MSILGIYDGHNAGAALVDSTTGRILAAVEEERLSRRKNHDARPGKDGPPTRSIEFCLSQRVGPLTAIALGLEEPTALGRRAQANFLAQVNSGQYQRLSRAAQLGISPDELLDLPIRTQSERSQASLSAAVQCGVEPGLPIHHIDHHRAHAAGAFFTSPFREALVITLDGKGDDLSGSVSIGRGAHLETLLQIPTEHSLGHMYSAFTVACGLRPQRDEGKLQAVAASGHANRRLTAWLEDRFRVAECGSIVGRLNDGLIVGPYPDRLPDLHNRLAAQAMQGIRKEDAAASVQAFLERIVSEFVSVHLSASGLRNLVVAGGVFANVSLNRVLAQLPGVDGFAVHPAMTDSGIAVGAAVAAVRSRYVARHSPISDAALGPEYGDSAKRAFAAEGYAIVEPEDGDDQSAEASLARALANGEVVARFVGRAEYGPRALGQRSILARADYPHMADELNARLSRSALMPFAPILRTSDADDLLLGWRRAEYCLPFMAGAVRCSERMRRDYPSAVHLDGTARPQLVSDGALSNLLTVFAALTGKRVLINTSFNLHDEPMVCHPTDAARTAKAAGITTVQVEDSVGVLALAR